MKAKHWLLAAGAVVMAVSMTYTSAFTQAAPKPDSGATAKPVDRAKPKAAAARRAAKIDPVDGKLISPYSLAERTALSRLDCLPNALRPDGVGMHGHYRTYGQWDPELKSIEGRKQFQACVKRGLEPTPWFAFGQRMMISTTGKFFGRGKDDCLKCHSKY